jgi:hypothetical protein
MLFAAVSAACLSAFAGLASAEEKSAQTLAGEAETLYQAASAVVEPRERGRLFYLVQLRFAKIRTLYPQSPIAAQLAFGRYGEVDVTMVDREARAWADANPADAAALQANAAPAAGGGGLVPTFGKSTQPSAVSAFGTSGAPANGGVGSAATAMFTPPPAGEIARTEAPTERLGQQELVRKLREAVVFVYDPVAEGWGTGFFISPTHLMTNAHVVGNSARFVVANRAIGVRAARVLYKGMTSGGVGIDTAVLQTDGWTHPDYLPFAQPSDVEEGEPIIIGGYPGLAQRLDKSYDQFLGLIRENSLPTADAIPNVKFDFGFVQSVFVNKETNIENVQNSITGTGGYSGSPIINQCGHVVGQHYSSDRLALDVRQGATVVDTAKFSYALSGKEMIKFLEAAKVAFSQAGGTCPIVAE